MTHAELAAAIKSHLLSVFPNIQVKVEPWDGNTSRIAVYVIDEAFAGLYPRQRFHYLIHSLPADFVEEHLSQSEWFELAPGESPEDLRVYDELDDDLIESIATDVMETLEKTGFFTALDDVMAPEDGTLEREPCHGDFRITKRILGRIFDAFQLNAEIDMVADVCHVLMFKGAYCDCEVLSNVYEGSRVGRRVWRKLSDEKVERVDAKTPS